MTTTEHALHRMNAAARPGPFGARGKRHREPVARLQEPPRLLPPRRDVGCPACRYRPDALRPQRGHGPALRLRSDALTSAPWRGSAFATRRRWRGRFTESWSRADCREPPRCGHAPRRLLPPGLHPARSLADRAFHSAANGPSRSRACVAPEEWPPRSRRRASIIADLAVSVHALVNWSKMLSMPFWYSSRCLAPVSNISPNRSS